MQKSRREVLDSCYNIRNGIRDSFFQPLYTFLGTKVDSETRERIYERVADGVRDGVMFVSDELNNKLHSSPLYNRALNDGAL